MNCHCGCNQEAKSKRGFLPGHDQKLRTALEERVGGLINLERLVSTSAAFARGALTSTKLETEIRAIFEQPGT